MTLLQPARGFKTVAGRKDRYMYRIIDWNELWKAIHAGSPGKAEKDRDPAAIWDKRAAAYHRITRDESEATRQELALLDLRPGDTVLDMGAGTGRLAVPVARSAAHVTALDSSGGMLSILEKRMAEAGLSNYSCVRMRWEDVVVGRDIMPHDVVIAAFSLGFYDLLDALRKLDAASLRTVYLFWHAGEWRGEKEMELYRAVFSEEEALKRGRYFGRHLCPTVRRRSCRTFHRLLCCQRVDRGPAESDRSLGEGEVRDPLAWHSKHKSK